MNKIAKNRGTLDLTRERKGHHYETVGIKIDICDENEKQRESQK